ncbi:MAG: penicillin-binding protein 2 [Aestuariivita sp.]|nr:penicillin-binding protein 2 [Aestuariivita sp.]
MKAPTNNLDRANSGLTRRTLILGGVQLSIVATLGLRMHHLQIKQSDEFRLLAEENRINIRLIPPARGKIFDKDGQLIAHNTPTYRVVIVREDAGDINTIIQKLRQLITLNDQQIDVARKELEQSPSFVRVTIAEHVSWNEVAAVAVNAPALPGVTPEVGFTREYPHAQNFSHVIGYVGPISDYDLEKIENPDQLLRIPRYQIGKVGLESRKEEVLRGKAGSKHVEVNAAGRVMRELEIREGQPGSDIQVTLDANLQNYVQARLGDISASAVVMDARTGDILAITSSPSYDPNKFVHGISSKDYEALLSNPYRPLASKSVQGIYPPGSTFKMITALAALEEGIIDTNEKIYCPGFLKVSGRRFYCWKHSGHGWVNMHQSIEQSCDVYYYSLARKIGHEKIASMARRFGLGMKHDLPMSAVASGLVPDKAWKRRVHSENWFVGDTVNVSIGQGFLLASPLQLCVMTARLATGRTITPRLIKTINGLNQPIQSTESLRIKDENLATIRKAMYAVTNDREGTAFSSRVIDDAYKLAGKTGTSQVRNISTTERQSGILTDDDLPWEKRDHALFVNFAPYDNPRIAVSVIVEHGGAGSKMAAPIARDITLQALHRGTPPLSVYPSKDRKKIREQQKRLHDLTPVADARASDRA